MYSLTRIIATIALLCALVAADLDTEKSKIKQTCAKILRVPDETIEGLQRGEYRESQDIYCFLRCTGLVAGAWDDETGLVVEKIYQFDDFGKPTEQELAETLSACQPSIAAEQDVCRRAFKALMCTRVEFYKAHPEAWKH